MTTETAGARERATPSVELIGVTKRFGSLLANDSVSLSVRPGEVHSLLGENGAGKTTLMKILFGLHRPDAGEIRLGGRPVSIESPTDAIKHGVGMVHQHFMLVPRLTVAENVVAGSEIVRRGFLDMPGATTRVRALAERYHLAVHAGALVEDISVGEQQRVEILKALYRDAGILILDEPTAVLTPQETEELFSIIRRLQADGKTIVFITHKLRETMEISDAVSVLRDGTLVGTVSTADTSAPELARMMVGREVLLRVERSESQPGNARLEVSGLSVPARYGAGVQEVSLHVRAGEIVGIAGVEGNGQLELEEAIAGLRRVESGEIRIAGSRASSGPQGRRRAGLAHIPSDRLRRGLIPAFSLAWNIILGSQWVGPFARRGVFQRERIREYARRLIEQFGIRAPGPNATGAALSGGNQQKLVVAREISRDPVVILACQPTRGVDVGAIEYIHTRLLELRAAGKAILLVSAELDEIRALSDRILVMYEGKITAERDGNCDEYELGLLMAGHRESTG